MMMVLYIVTPFVKMVTGQMKILVHKIHVFYVHSNVVYVLQIQNASSVQILTN